MKSAKCTPANDAGTIWVLRRGTVILINACYVDDDLHFTNSARLHRDFCKSFQKEFNVPSSDTARVDVYLGNEVTVDNAKHRVVLSQSHYILSCLDSLGMIN